MRDRALSLLMRPTSPPLALGIVVAVALIPVGTLVVCGARSRVRERVVASMQPLLRAARDREGMGSAVAR
jgi:hypothetical protein